MLKLFLILVSRDFVPLPKCALGNSYRYRWNWYTNTNYPILVEPILFLNWYTNTNSLPISREYQFYQYQLPEIGISIGNWYKYYRRIRDRLPPALFAFLQFISISKFGLTVCINFGSPVQHQLWLECPLFANARVRYQYQYQYQYQFRLVTNTSSAG